MKGNKLSPAGSPLMTILDLCHLLGISQTTVRKWVDQGKMPEPVRFSSARIRWRREEIEEFMKTGKVPDKDLSAATG